MSVKYTIEEMFDLDEPYEPSEEVVQARKELEKRWANAEKDLDRYNKEKENYE